MNIRKFIKIWGIPIVLAILCLYGLISALVGNGVYDAIACISLFVPLIVIIRYYFRGSQNNDPDEEAV